MTCRSLARWVLLALLPLQAACSSGPIRGIYVFEGQEKAVSTVASAGNRPVVEIKPVLVPDYLDTTDILLRDGTHELKASPTGQWGERLSVGVTNAVTNDLATRMPGIVVSQAGSGQQPIRIVMITITSFDVWPDHRCVLTAGWTVLDKSRQNVHGGEQATVVVPVGGTSDHLADGSVVAAMSEAVRQLTDRIAADLTQTISNRPSHGF